MFDVKREYWSCMGESVLKKSKFDQDVANAHTQERGHLDNLAAMYTQAVQQNAGQTAVLQPQPPALPFIPALIQTGVRLLMQPVRVLVNILQAMVQIVPMTAAVVGQAIARAEKVIAQIWVFFFGQRKERTEEEKDNRKQNDFLQLSLQGERKVESSEGAGLGGGK